MPVWWNMADTDQNSVLNDMVYVREGSTPSTGSIYYMESYSSGEEGSLLNC